MYNVYLYRVSHFSKSILSVYILVIAAAVAEMRQNIRNWKVIKHTKIPSFVSWEKNRKKDDLKFTARKNFNQK